jgi:hypothetical protein
MMYNGSSGCPVFKHDGIVFGIQSATLVAEEGADDEYKRLSVARARSAGSINRDSNG